MLHFKPIAIHALALLSRGEPLHRSALEAMHEERWRDADVLFEAAARCYRRDLEVERLARLRVHQLMTRVLSGCEPGLEAEDCVEVERRLSQLDQIESLAPPFALVDAGTLLAGWLREAPDAAGAQASDIDLARAA